MTTFLAILKSVAIFYVFLTAALYFLQGYLIFVPYHSSPPALEDTPLAALAAPITIKAEDGIDVTSWIIPPKEGDAPIILFFHGNAAHALQGFARAIFFHGQGYGYVLAEYRGYGGNKGSPNEDKIYNDTRRLILSIKEQYPNAPIILYGESLGTGVATQMATEFEIKALILEAPFTSVTELAKANYPYIPVSLLLKHRFESIEKIDQINAPLHIIHGRLDHLIPPHHGVALFNAASEPKTIDVIEGSGHNDLMLHGSLDSAIAFLNSLKQR